MHKLVNAEWYRLRKSGNYLKFLIFVSLIFILFSFTGGKIQDRDLYSFMYEYLSIASVFIPALLGTMLAVTIGNIYGNKTAHYEVMDGNNTHAIILTRVVVYMPIVITLYLIPALVFIFIAYSNGTAGISHPTVLILLFVLIVIRMSLSAIFCVMSLKNHVAGALIPYARAMLESLIPISTMAFIPNAGSNQSLIKALDYIFAVFAPEQMAKIIDKTDDMKYIIIVIASCIFDIALGYFCCIRSYNRKNFK